MLELVTEIPDAVMLLTLEPEELGAKLLFLARKKSFQRDMFKPTDLNAQLWTTVRRPGQDHPYPLTKKDAIEIALTEAWAWLEAQGLIVPAPDPNGALVLPQLEMEKAFVR